jgi:50S ribosomal protein L16 3-hydroxylase
MLPSWLDGTTREEFTAAHFQKEPFARAATAAAAVPLLTWETVERLVETPGRDILVVRNGRLSSEPEPTTAAETRDLFSRGWSIVLRRCERHDPALSALAGEFERELEGDVSIQIYATPARFISFGWHYDCEDVFIVQTAGEKEYLLRRNTVNPEPTLDAMPRDMQAERETTPVISSTLVPGDWLYIPRGWWHVARAAETSLSISVGVLSPAAAGRK